MSNLSNPTGVIVDPAERAMRQSQYKGSACRGRFVIEGEDAYWLEKFARDRHMTVDALVKVYIMEGLFRARVYNEM